MSFLTHLSTDLYLFIEFEATLLFVIKRNYHLCASNMRLTSEDGKCYKWVMLLFLPNYLQLNNVQPKINIFMGSNSNSKQKFRF